MTPFELPTVSVEATLRFVRALGTHRYVAGRLHMIHAFVFEALGDEAAGRAWASTVLETVDIASRDERLWRRSTDAELLAVLDGFWTPGARSERAREALLGLLDRAELELPDTMPFDDDAEEGMHPLLVDAGWELLPLMELREERHRGAIEAFGEPIFFEAAVFDEETSIPSPSYLHELTALGPAELLFGANPEGNLVAPFVLWVEGNETYQDYVLRGVQRAAKL